MERFLTSFICALCTAPLVFILTIPINRSAPGQRPGLSDSLFLSAGIALLGFVLAGGLSWYLVTHGYLRPVQTLTGLMLAGWSLTGAAFAWKEPRPLDYSGQRGVLEAEIRVVKSMLEQQPVTQAVIPSFLGGSFERNDARGIRDEGNFVIMPWETTVTIVYDWAIRITLLHAEYVYFPLELPYRPTQSTDWSAWAIPNPHKHSSTPTGLTLRYRFRLEPESVNQP